MAAGLRGRQLHGGYTARPGLVSLACNRAAGTVDRNREAPARRTHAHGTRRRRLDTRRGDRPGREGISRRSAGRGRGVAGGGVAGRGVPEREVAAGTGWGGGGSGTLGAPGGQREALGPR